MAGARGGARLLAALCWPAGASAAGEPLRPQPGPLSQAFVEALHDPLAGAFGKLPNPVEVHLDAGAAAQAVETRTARQCLPRGYDLRVRDRLTAVKDQRQYGTCWAFANLAALESRLLPGERRDFSEDNLITRSGYGPFAGGPYIWGGWDFMAVAYLARWAGPVDQSDDRYLTPRLPRHNAVRKHVQSVVMLPGRKGFLDNDVLKYVIMQNGAVSAGMYYDDAFDSFDGSDPTTATYYCDRAAGEKHEGHEIGENHGVCIVGWEDTFPAWRFSGSSAGPPPGDGAFIVRNSWGATWGDRGYFWVSYYDRSFAFDDCTSYARVEPVGNYSRNYQYDKLGWTTSWGYPDAPDPAVAWGANRFTAKASGHVDAAGFYAPASGTEYELWAGPSLGSLTRRAAGSLILPGFTTVDLDAPLAVRAGKRFVVAVRVVAPGETHPLAVERPMERWESAAAAKAGQSYMRYGDGDPWFDLAGDTQNPDANVCLKAFARE